MKQFEAPYYSEDQMAELEEKDLQFPYSDKYLTYDSIKRQYPSSWLGVILPLLFGFF